MMNRTLFLIAAVAALTAVAASPDLNGDGRIDRRDHDLLATAIAEGRYLAAYDLDGNGELDTVDLNRLLDDTQYNAFGDVTFTVNGVSFTMVAVKGGTFTMGATSEQGSDAFDSEKPAHQVTLSDYWIGETEVTERLWTAVMGSNPSYYKIGDSYPVEAVSWEDCQTFISKLNSLTGETFRLPTEAEWEFAARGGTQSQGCKYSGSNTIGNVAWYTDNSGSAKHPVATKAANELGLYDMSGNVWEWCQDWYSSSYYSSSPSTNPTGPTTGSYRVDRGGSGSSSAWGCRVSYRSRNEPSLRGNLGVRLAR